MRVRRVREVRQLGQAECGLCCVAMILSAYGSRNTVTSLRRSHETGRDGLSIKEIVTILRQHAMQVRTFRAPTSSMARLRFPLIAYWDDSHAVVVERISTHVTVVDPASGRRKFSVEEFERHYSGLVIEATPTSSYQPVHHREPSVWWEFLRSLRHARKPLAVTFLISLLLYSFTLLIPLTVQASINNFGDLYEARPLALLLVLVTVPMLTYLALSFLRTFFLAMVIRRLGEAMMGKVFKTLLQLPYKYFASRSQGELMYRLSSVSSVRDLISSQVTAVLLDLGTLVVAFTYIFLRSPTLGLAALVLLLCMVSVAAIVYLPIRRVMDREISETAESSARQLEAMSSIEVLKVSGMTVPFFQDWRSVYARAMDQTQRRIVLQGSASSAFSMFQVFGPLLVLLTGLWLVSQERLDLGSAVAAQALTATSLGVVMSLSQAFTQVIMANSQVARLSDILRQPSEEGAFGSRQVKVRGAVSVRDLSFSYPGAKTPVLEEVSFEVPAGARVAIVGSTGSGKSTLGRLLMGLYLPSKGDIVYDGASIRDISADAFYSGVSYVPQEVVLSNRAIAENIRFGVPDADLSTVVDAARRAQIHQDVEAMPMGYFTQVREMGGSLSGGQRQRIALARALARQPRVLILDEATSALDTVTESMVADALNRLECTRIVIAHRLSTVIDADLIVVLQEGRVVQAGSHTELVSVLGPYRALVGSQVLVGDGGVQPHN